MDFALAEDHLPRPAGDRAGASEETPIIGLTSWLELTRWRKVETMAVVLEATTLGAVEAVGGRPLVLGPSPLGPAETASSLDGLILTGGTDVGAVRYGQEPHPRTDPVQALRDESEELLLKAALAIELPVLGICRGFQIMNVALGGTLHQHLPDRFTSVTHAPDVTGDAIWRYEEVPWIRHPVEVKTGSLAERLSIPGDIYSFHHQGVDRLAQPLTATGWAEDGLVEAAEIPGLPFALGVQWHPEAGEDQVIFGALVEAARLRRKKRLQGPA